jgi:hypothetical protein
LALNLLMPLIWLLSGRPKKPTSNLTNCRQKPNKMGFAQSETLLASHSPHNTQKAMFRAWLCRSGGIVALVC